MGKGGGEATDTEALGLELGCVCCPDVNTRRCDTCGSHSRCVHESLFVTQGDDKEGRGCLFPNPLKASVRISWKNTGESWICHRDISCLFLPQRLDLRQWGIVYTLLLGMSMRSTCVSGSALLLAAYVRSTSTSTSTSYEYEYNCAIFRRTDNDTNVNLRQRA